MKLAQMKVSGSEEQVLVDVTGEIDRSNAADLLGACTAAVTNQALGVVLDLTEVTYLDSAGVHLVFLLAKRLRSRGQRFGLIVTGESTVHTVLELCSVHEVCGFTVVNTKVAASA